MSTYTNKYEFEYNEYVVGFIVTHKEDGRQANLQFNYNPAAGKHEWVFMLGCEGDNTYEVFSDEEREEIEHAAHCEDNVLQTEGYLFEIFDDYDMRQVFEELAAHQGAVSQRDIYEISVGFTLDGTKGLQPTV